MELQSCFVIEMTLLNRFLKIWVLLFKRLFKFQQTQVQDPQVSGPQGPLQQVPKDLEDLAVLRTPGQDEPCPQFRENCTGLEPPSNMWPGHGHKCRKWAAGQLATPQAPYSQVPMI